MFTFVGIHPAGDPALPLARIRESGYRKYADKFRASQEDTVTEKDTERTTASEDTLNPITHPFDQTNGLADDLDGDSDGTAESDTRSEAERTDDDESGAGVLDGDTSEDATGPEGRKGPGAVPPLGGALGQH